MSDAGFDSDFKQGNQTMWIIREILGTVLIRVANDHEDKHHNTDLCIQTPYGPIRIAVRVRKHKYFTEDYKYEFTLCCGRKSGEDAEYQKIKRGYGDYTIYGFEDESGEHVIWWFVGVLDAFRKADPLMTFRQKGDDKKLGEILLNHEKIGYVKKVKRHNNITFEPYYDYFYVYDRRKIPGFVIADSEHWEDLRI